MIIPKKNLSTDFVVVGGGMAGICAAVAAARNGIKTVLVQDRPNSEEASRPVRYSAPERRRMLSPEQSAKKRPEIS